MWTLVVVAGVRRQVPGVWLGVMMSETYAGGSARWTGRRDQDTPTRFVYYRDEHVYLTERELHVHDDRYELDLLCAVYTSRGGMPTAVPLSGAVAFLLGSGALIAVLASHETLTVPMSAGLLVSAVTAGAAWRSRPYELWGDYDDAHVLLYRTRNATRFHKVCRSLRRALTRY